MNRNLPHPAGSEVFIQHDYSFVSKVTYRPFPLTIVYFFKDEETGEFTKKYEPGGQDWYITVAIDKLDKVKDGEITYSLVMQYRWAIREGYNHQHDQNLRNSYDQPRNKNTMAGVKGYIERIKKANDAMMAKIEEYSNINPNSIEAQGRQPQ